MRQAKHILRIAGTIVIACCGMVAAACQDDEVAPLSVEEYFTRVEAIERDADRRTDELEAETSELFAGDFTLDDERLEGAQDAYHRFGEILDDFVADLRALDPPAEVVDAHNAYVDAAEALGEAFNGVADGIDDVDSVGAALALFAIADQPGDQAEAACNRLESIASDNGIQANLECDED